MTSISADAAASTNRELPISQVLGERAGFAGALAAAAVAQFVDGRLPFAAERSLAEVADGVEVALEGGVLVRRVEGPNLVRELWEGPEWVTQIRLAYGTAAVEVCAASAAVASSVADEVVRQLSVTGGADERLEIGFWHREGYGPNLNIRRIDAPRWSEVRRNYSATVQAAVDELADLEPNSGSGRLLLLHGPPGTGKTSLLATLGREWRSWCRLDVVLDPEAMFADSSYLLGVMAEGDGDEGDRWRLLVLEDCDQVMQAGSAGLARLLNLTDGLLGRGSPTMVAITTNERLSRLHPAVTRPGRCLRELRVPRLSRDEAVAWLGSADGVGADGASLAELSARRDGTAPPIAEAPTTPGQYL